MKSANMVVNAGAVMVIIAAAFKIFHIGFENNWLLIFSLVVGSLGQSWKIRLLEKQIKSKI